MLFADSGLNIFLFDYFSAPLYKHNIFDYD